MVLKQNHDGNSVFFFLSCTMGRCFKRCCFHLFRGRCISVRLNPSAMHFCKRKHGLLSTHPTSPAAATLLLPIFTPLIMHESQIGRIHLRRSFRTGFGFTEGFQTFIAAIIHRKVDLGGVWCEEWLMQVSLGLFFLAQNHLLLTGVLLSLRSHTHAVPWKIRKQTLMCYINGAPPHPLQKY